MRRPGFRLARRRAGRAVRALHPLKIADAVRRGFAFRRAMDEFERLPDAAEAPEELLARLVHGWGNELMSAMPGYLDASLKELRAARGDVLECGSGLSTILLGVLAGRTGKRIWSLEHDGRWARRMRAEIRRRDIRGVEIVHAPLRDYGAFSWYDPPLERLPARFSLVLCDGPPGDTPGGRYGMLPAMRGRLGGGCVILLDDLHRPAEREIAARWARELGGTCEVRGTGKPHAVIVAP
jgi:hypothetical protein